VTETEDLFGSFTSADLDVDTALAEPYALEVSAEGDDAILECESSSDPASRDEAHKDVLLAYLHALRSMPLLDRHGEVAVAKRIERAYMDRLSLVLESPLSAHILGAFCARLHDAGLTLDNAPAIPDTSGSAAPERLQAIRTTLAEFTQKLCPSPGQTEQG